MKNLNEVRCIACEHPTEYWKEEDDGNYCPSCYADLVGISASEVWACIE